MLVLALVDIELREPGPGDVVVRVGATPINPSDQLRMFGPADPGALAAGGTPERPTLTGPIPESALAGVAGRLGQSQSVGNEGAGTVVSAGAGAEHLLGKLVGAFGGGMFATLRLLPAAGCVVLPEGTTAADGAALFVNPLTAIGFVETLRVEGHRAMVHPPAASNLGQMPNRVCLKDGIPLVNVVRGDAQRRLLLDAGAQHVLDSTVPDYEAELVDAVAETGATLAFDAIGGGTQASRVLAAMRRANVFKISKFSLSGSGVQTQVYVYGSLDPPPVVLDCADLGYAWGVARWFLPASPARLGDEATARLKRRVVDELATTFVSRYAATVSLADLLRPEVVRDYVRKSTGKKYLVDPSR